MVSQNSFQYSLNILIIISLTMCVTLCSSVKHEQTIGQDKPGQETTGKMATPLSSYLQDVYYLEPVYDCGVIKQGQTVQHSFVLKNASNASVKILSVKETCDNCACRVISYGENLPPYQQDFIRVNLYAGRESGPVTCSVRVLTDNEQVKDVTLAMKAYVSGVDSTIEDDGSFQSAFGTFFAQALVPDSVYNFGEIKSGTHFEHAFPIHNTGTKPLRIFSVTWSNPENNVAIKINDYKQEIWPGTQSNISVNVYTEGVLPGTKTWLIQIATNNKDNQTLELVLQGIIR